MDLDRHCTKVAKQAGRDAAAPEEGAAPAIALERAANDERLTASACDALLLEESMDLVGW
jgi:hypothetical protein